MIAEKITNELTMADIDFEVGGTVEVYECNDGSLLAYVIDAKGRLLCIDITDGTNLQADIWALYNAYDLDEWTVPVFEADTVPDEPETALIAEADHETLTFYWSRMSINVMRRLGFRDTLNALFRD